MVSISIHFCTREQDLQHLSVSDEILLLACQPDCCNQIKIYYARSKKFKVRLQNEKGEIKINY